MDSTKAMLNTIVSIFSTMIAWISIKDAQTMITFIASCIAAGSGLLAARYYWFAAKEKKDSIQRNKTKK
jgi:uncharacterized membrane-anchored protein